MADSPVAAELAAIRERYCRRRIASMQEDLYRSAEDVPRLLAMLAGRDEEVARLREHLDADHMALARAGGREADLLGLITGRRNAGLTPEQMLREFHASKAVHGGYMPRVPTADIPDWIRDLRADLLAEEIRELDEAIAERDSVKIADAIGDIAFVLVGTAVVYGIPFDAVLAEVFRSNMTKVNSPAEAKLVKGPGYERPRIAELLGLDEPVDMGYLSLPAEVQAGIEAQMAEHHDAWASGEFSHEGEEDDDT